MIRPFLDLDGVLVDFVGGAFRVHGRKPEPVNTWNFHEAWGLTTEQFFAPMGYDFWAGLGPTEDATRIVDTIRRHAASRRIALLSSPCQTPGCVEGKREWVKKWFPQLLPNLILTSAKHLIAARGSLLIDDSDDNIYKWRNGGGVGFTWPQTWNLGADRVGDRVQYLTDYLEGLYADL